MLLIISLIIVALFIYFLKDSLKKYANIFYIGVAVISIAVFLLEFLPMPLFVKNNILGIFAKGSIGTAMFVAVMYTGALPKGSKLIAPLMKIRGELSITAAILVLCHNFTYGITYFKMLFIKPEALSATQLTAAIISLVLIIIMIVLTVTSFQAVRKKMQAKKWKQLQRTAYVFYGLMYVHIMLINIPYARLGLGMYIANVVIYSIVFLGYAAMRIAKAVSVKAARAGKTYGKKPETVLYGLALVICAVMTVSCFAGRQTVSASEDNEEWNDFFNEETVAAMVKEIESSTAKTDAEGTTQEAIEQAETELHKTFATLSQEEQKYAQIFIHDIQSGEVQIERGKTFREYITEYMHNAENDKIRKVADILGLDENKLRNIVNLKVNENNINAFGRFDELLKSVDLEKAKNYLEKISNRELSMFDVNIEIGELLRKFILDNGFDIDNYKINI